MTEWIGDIFVEAVEIAVTDVNVFFIRREIDQLSVIFWTFVADCQTFLCSDVDRKVGG